MPISYISFPTADSKCRIVDGIFVVCLTCIPAAPIEVPERDRRFSFVGRSVEGEYNLSSSWNWTLRLLYRNSSAVHFSGGVCLAMGMCSVFYAIPGENLQALRLVYDPWCFSARIFATWQSWSSTKCGVEWEMTKMKFFVASLVSFHLTVTCTKP